MGPLFLQRLSYKCYKHYLTFIARQISIFNNLLYSCDLSYPTYFPKSTIFKHNGIGVVIHGNTEIGENVTILQGVTIGEVFKVDKKGVPKLGDNIMIGAGACVLGPITIGNNVKIGANSVVLRDVPNNVTVAGSPAKIVNRQYS